MEYSECSNGKCVYNEQYLCKAGGMDEDIICKKGKVDAGRSVRFQQKRLYRNKWLFEKLAAYHNVS